jgi:Uma2 family endonuclease
MRASLEISRRLLTTDDFHRMGDAGILGPEDKVELLEGELIQMAPIGGPHLSVVNCLTTLFSRQVYGLAVVSVQNPVSLPPHSETQPDLALLKWNLLKKPVTPGASDVFLVIEVASTTLRYDRDVKMGLYGRHGIPEAWLVDVEAGTVLVHRGPSESGYREVSTATKLDTISPQLLPDVKIPLADLW